MFLTAVLRVTVERFSANVNVMKDIVCTKAEDGKEGGGGSEGRRREGEMNARRLAGASFLDRGTALRIKSQISLQCVVCSD